MANNIKITKSYQEYKWIGGIKAMKKRGQRIYREIYTLLQDYEEMSLLIDFMNEGETFIDVGATSAHIRCWQVNCNAKVIAFEPIESYKRLKNNIKINNLAMQGRFA